jgi:hypothetical protein
MQNYLFRQNWTIPHTIPMWQQLHHGVVETNSNAILVEPMTSKKDKEMIRAYNALILRLKQAGSVKKTRARQRGFGSHEEPYKR